MIPAVNSPKIEEGEGEDTEPNATEKAEVMVHQRLGKYTVAGQGLGVRGGYTGTSLGGGAGVSTL